MIERPHIEDAPGLKWRPRKDGGWQARWVCRTDLKQRGCPLKIVKLFNLYGPPTPEQIELAQTICQQAQGEMLAWAQQGLPVVASFDKTIRGLLACFRGMKDSRYNKVARHSTRTFYDQLCMSILDLSWTDENGMNQKFSQLHVSNIKRLTLERVHEIYTDRGHIAMGHAIMAFLRTVFGFGAGVLEDTDCARLCMVMSNMRFELPKPRTEILTAEMAIAVRAKARELGLPSIGLAQAFQFDGMLRQKDVLGEWVPLKEKRTPLTDIVSGDDKWIRGLRWEELDKNMVFHHVTSKRNKPVTLPLKLMPMVLEELGNPIERGQLPAKGPIVICERTQEPWRQRTFSLNWRIVAEKAGVPKEVKNMDSRAGAITEATQTGMPLESIKHAATHSDIATTQRYARAAESKTEEVMKARIAYRNKGGN